MSAVNFEIISLISQPVILEVFRKILKFRILSRSQIEKSELDRTQIIDALDKLQSLGLIDKKAANFHELDRYYPTREGLDIEKIVK